MIEDSELREIFKVESAEHIQRLEDGFLRLEAEPDNAALLEEVFREAHSLKGAARIIGLTGIESLSHRLEDILGVARKGSVPLTPDMIDRLCNGLDAIRALVTEAVSGEPSGVIVSKVIQILALNRERGVIRTAEPVEGYDRPGEQPDDSPPDASQAALAVPLRKAVRPAVVKGKSGVKTQKTGKGEFIFPDSQPSFNEPENSDRQPEVNDAIIGDFRIDTIRVETKRLDTLMSQAGELNVTKLRINRRVDDAKDAIALWEEAAKTVVASGGQGAGLNEESSAFERLGASLNSLKNSLYVDSSRLDFVNAELEGSINRIRLLPLSTIFNLFQRMVRDLAKEKAKEIELVITGGDTVADKRIIEEMKDPLMHMVRNAVDHGIESPEERERKNKPRCATISIKAYQGSANVVIEVSDDGQGLDEESIKKSALKAKIAHEAELAAMSTNQVHSLIFVSGISTSTFISDVSGRGVGLDVVRANVERLKGLIEVESIPDRGCSIRVRLPLTLATSRVMLVMVNNGKYAIPVEHIHTTRLLYRKDIFTIEGRQTTVFDNLPVSIMPLAELLELKAESPLSAVRTPLSEVRPCIILSIGGDRVGVLADEILDEQEIVLKQYSSVLKRVRNVSGATILGTGEVCMVLNPFDLVKSIKMKKAQPAAETTVQDTEITKCILVAEDSMTVRTQMKRIIEGAGYEVVVAVDGVDAFKKLSGRSFDALVSDINMPNMNGLTLTEKVRQNKKFKDMPVILVTSLASDDDKQRGLEAGANAYIPKPSFDQKVFLETLGRLV